jgi:hypothetical protein
MVRFAVAVGVLAFGFALFGWTPADRASGAVEQEAVLVAEARAAAAVTGTADLEMRFVQEGEPDSGHVRVVLTPETRPLTILEARSAAQQGFLEALNEEGLGDQLRRLVVVVRLMPKSHPDPAAAEEVFRFLHKGGRDWTVLVGE